ncbi:MAG: flagellar protein [Sulfurimonas sp.]
MLKWTVYLLIFLGITTSLEALEISINSAKENHQRFSILHLKDSQEFICQETKNDFNEAIEIICAYNKRPNQEIKKLKNNFFTIDSVIKNKTFFLVIKPFKKIKLLPVIFNLCEEDRVYQADVTLAKHWMIVGYTDKLPLINNKEKANIGINFPFFMQKDKLPFVGGLDIKGNPVHIKQVGDVTDYLKVKKYFKEEKYELVLDLINDVLEAYPNTLFKAELLYYKIKVYDKMKNNDSVVATSKIYLREYSSDENIAEVLSLLAKSYSSMGLSTDADYFFDRLFSEHEKSVYTLWGYIYKGEMLEGSGGTKGAINFYTKALDETNDLDLGATAAYHLAHLEIGYSPKRASKYIMQIVDAKPNFFIKDLKTSLDMMTTFSDAGDFVTAAAMADSLAVALTMGSDDYEGLLKDKALWLAKTEDKKEALDAINAYIKAFPDGDFIYEVQTVKDALFFDTQELNATSKLAQYNRLIKDYANDSIGNRAIYEKAKFLLESGEYAQVLDFKNDLLELDKDKYEDIQNIIMDSAVGSMKNSLQDKKCHQVLSISNDYNVTLWDKWDDGIYECAMKGGDFTLAKSMANKHFKSKKLDERKKWLYRYIKIDFQTGNYSDVLDASKDLISLIDDAKTSPYKDVYRYIFDTYQRLEQADNAIKVITDIENSFGINYKDLDRYMALVTIGQKRKDDNIVIKYGLLVYKIQEDSHSHPQSPMLEFTLYQAYMNQEQLNKALEIIVSLNEIKLEPSQTARQQYLLGTVYSKLWRDEDAKKAYKNAINADKTSPWAKLASSALDI